MDFEQRYDFVVRNCTRKKDGKANHDVLTSTEVQKRLLVLDALPAVCTFWLNFKLVYCNQAAANLFGLKDPQDYIDCFENISPRWQPCGTPSMEKAMYYVGKAVEEGVSKFEWMHQNLDGIPIPTEVTLKRVVWQDEIGVVGHTADLRETREAVDMLTRLIDAAPLFVETWDSSLNLINCNEHARRLLKAKTRDEFVNNNAKFYPKYQPCGTDSKEKELAMLKHALQEGHSKFEFTLLTTEGEELHFEYIYVLIRLRRKAYIIGYGYNLSKTK